MREFLIGYLCKYTHIKAIKHLRGWIFDLYHYRTLNFYFFYIKYGTARALDSYNCYSIDDFITKETKYKCPNPFYFKIGLK